MSESIDEVISTSVWQAVSDSVRNSVDRSVDTDVRALVQDYIFNSVLSRHWTSIRYSVLSDCWYFVRDKRK